MTDRLIPMTTFVLEQQKTIIDSENGNLARLDFVDIVCRYANFLKQPLTLGMFVPCDEVGEVLEEPEMYMAIQNVGSMNSHATEQDCADAENYHRAKSRCLFEGFVVEEHEEGCYSVRCENNIVNVMWKFHNEDWRPAKGIISIEDLSRYGLTLTPYAKELIYKH